MQYIIDLNDIKESADVKLRGFVIVLKSILQIIPNSVKQTLFTQVNKNILKGIVNLSSCDS